MGGQVDDLIVLLAMTKVEGHLLVTWEVRIPPLLKDLDQHGVHPVTLLAAAAIMAGEDKGPLEIERLVDSLPRTPHLCTTNKNGTIFCVDFQISSYIAVLKL